MTYGELHKLANEIAALVSMLSACDKDDEAVIDRMKDQIIERAQKIGAAFPPDAVVGIDLPTA
jgi:enoyl reductase-like protein